MSRTWHQKQCITLTMTSSRWQGRMRERKERKGKKPNGVKVPFNNGSLSLKWHTIVWPTFHSQARCICVKQRWCRAGFTTKNHMMTLKSLYFIEKRWERSKQEERKRERLISIKQSLCFSQLVLPHSSASTVSIDSPPSTYCTELKGNSLFHILFFLYIILCDNKPVCFFN